MTVLSCYEVRFHFPAKLRGYSQIFLNKLDMDDTVRHRFTSLRKMHLYSDTDGRLILPSQLSFLFLSLAVLPKLKIYQFCSRTISLKCILYLIQSKSSGEDDLEFD